MDPNAEQVGRHYDAIFKYESRRLLECPVEFVLTCRALKRWVPEQAVVAEIGVGGGQYSEFLARRGARLDLVDVSDSLLGGAGATGESRAGKPDSRRVPGVGYRSRPPRQCRVRHGLAARASLSFAHNDRASPGRC